MAEVPCIGIMLFLHGSTLLRTRNRRLTFTPTQRPHPYRIQLNQEVIASVCGATSSLMALYWVVTQDPPALTLLPSPIFLSSFPHQHYSGLSFLAALTIHLRTVFSQFQRIFTSDPSHSPKYIELSNNDQFIIKASSYFCKFSFLIQSILLNANPRIEVDSEIVREVILFGKEAITAILTNISTIHTLIASLPSDSSPTTSLDSGDDMQLFQSLIQLRKELEDFLQHPWGFFVHITYSITDPHKSSFQTIILDDPSFPDLTLNSIKLNNNDVRVTMLMAITNVVIEFPLVKEKFMTSNLVGRMFETVDFASLPLSESSTKFYLTRFIACMLRASGNTDEARFEQYPPIRVSVFEPAKPLIIFMFHNSDKLILNEKDKAELETRLCWIHNHIKNMELRSDEHDADIVSEFVNWEIRTMVQMENGTNFKIVFESIGNRTWEWKRDNPDRQKRREELLREEGWDDALELRVVGIEKNTDQNLLNCARLLGVVLSFNF
ncbi:hypothetical protein BLNAU_14220 [Blattamonas nauphoetae]|uniref:Uncharacterized protein n=1 Tax=Blattamonas nauphoetae TaxID=2049346 RepID=A0ABQ9XJM7_9EUKA|nr:hypothetical protein BLNAU_14220 [Blattamonas nauphoetae]